MGRADHGRSRSRWPGLGNRLVQHIVQHNPTPQGFTTGKGNAYESDLRDKTHGRIYRVVYDEAPAEATKSPKLSKDDPQSLIAGLKHSNRLWRRHAQRLLVERVEIVVPALIELVKDNRSMKPD